MAELAPFAVDAVVGRLHKALAEGHAVLAGDMCLLHQLVLTMSEGALVAKLA